MKKIKLTQNLKIHLCRVENSILIISEGIESPFYYDDLLKKTILNNINLNFPKTTIYFDMLSCVGSNSQRFLKIDFVNDYKMFDSSSIENIEFSNIPMKLRNMINKFYSLNAYSLDNNSLLSQNEKRELLQAV